jgi:hypothetical protein
MEKVKSDIYPIHNQKADFAGIMNFGGNIAVYLTDEGVILVDSKFESMHDDTVAKVRSLTNKPIRYVLLTHNHRPCSWERSRNDAGAEIGSHEWCAAAHEQHFSSRLRVSFNPFIRH